jgi:ribonuclease HII
MAGADEAGRGCFAGPLVTAAVVFDYSRIDTDFCTDLLQGLRDSKKMTGLARQRLYPHITRCAARFAVVVTAARSIDDGGLHRANLDGLKVCLQMVSPMPDGRMLVDGYRLPEGSPPHQPLKGGDSLSACVAAASVVAKVTRDRLMRRLHVLYPAYGFDRHVGYGTREHREAIARHGYSPLHRRSFSSASIPGARPGAHHGVKAGNKSGTDASAHPGADADPVR